jgi:hypothetical protein
MVVCRICTGRELQEDKRYGLVELVPGATRMKMHKVPKRERELP